MMDLIQTPRGTKALDFPAKKRIKGKRGGRKDKIVDTRSSELQTWLNTAIRVCESEGVTAGDMTPEQIVEQWFVSSSVATELAADAAESGSESARSSVASRTSQAAAGATAEEAELMAAIQASLGGGAADSDMPEQIAGFRAAETSGVAEGLPPQGLIPQARMTSLAELVSVDTLPATIGERF